MSDKKHANVDRVHYRRQSRELALCTLYAYEAGNGDSLEDMLEYIVEIEPDQFGANVGASVKEYAAELLNVTVSNLESIDSMIAQKAVNWELRRMAAVDRNMMRIAAAELAYFKELVPYKVVIDEAVEIAKIYGTDDSGKFVNGILDSIRKDLYREISKSDGKEEKKDIADA